jgi:hypothetical protein
MKAKGVDRDSAREERDHSSGGREQDDFELARRRQHSSALAEATLRSFAAALRPLSRSVHRVGQNVSLSASVFRPQSSLRSQLWLSGAEGVGTRGSPAGAYQAFEHFKIESSRQQGRQRITRSRRGQHLYAVCPSRSPVAPGPALPAAPVRPGVGSDDAVACAHHARPEPQRD